MGDNKTLVNIALIAIIAFVVGIVAEGTGITDFTTFGREVATDGDGTINVQSSPEDITLNWNDYDLQDRSNDPASNLRVYDPDRTAIADDGTATFGPNADLKAIAAFESTTYYAKAVNFNTGNADQLDYDAGGVARIGTLTITTINSNGITDNTGTAEALGASDDTKVEVCYEVQSNRYWGAQQAAGKSLYVCDYNKTTISKIKMDGRNPDGVIPNVHNRNTTITTANTVSFYIENLVDGEKKCFDIEPYSTSTQPVTGEAIQCHFLDANVDLDAEKYTILEGVEDESFNALSYGRANHTILLS